MCASTPTVSLSDKVHPTRSSIRWLSCSRDEKESPITDESDVVRVVVDLDDERSSVDLDPSLGIHKFFRDIGARVPACTRHDLDPLIHGKKHFHHAPSLDSIYSRHDHSNRLVMRSKREGRIATRTGWPNVRDGFQRANISVLRHAALTLNHPG